MFCNNEKNSLNTVIFYNFQEEEFVKNLSIFADYSVVSCFRVCLDKKNGF